MTKIIAIPGSIRKDSFNKKLVNAFAELAPEGVEVEVFYIDEIPMFSEDYEPDNIPQNVKDLAEKIKNSDGVVLSTPEYNSSTSGALLNTLDWLSRSSVGKPLVGKTLGLMGATMGGWGTVKAQRFIQSQALVYGMIVSYSPTVTVPSVHEKFDENGKLIDERTKEQILKLYEYLVK